MLCWPAWMPKPQRANYAYEPVERRSRTEMEVGSLLRVNYDTDETTLTCTLVLNRTQSAWFETFEQTLLRQGSAWFRMPIQTGGRVAWHTVRFAARPKAGNLIGAGYAAYTLRLDLERREGLMCAALAELLLCVPPDDLLKTSEALKAVVQGLPVLRVPDFWLHTCRKRKLLYEFGLL